MRIAQLSDTHISHLGGATLDNLARIAAFVNTQLKPDLVVHTGDVVVLDPDDAADRAAAREALTAIDAPLRVLPGNHDVGETFHSPWAGLHATPERVRAFTEVFGPDRFLEFVGDWAVIGLDTEILAADFAEAREQWGWIETLLERIGDRPAIVFGHKPLFPPLPGEQEHQMSVPAAAAGRLHRVLAEVDVRAYGSGHLHRYQLDRTGDAWVVSAPAVGFTAGAPTSMPGLHQLGVVEYRIDAREVTPLFRSVPTLTEQSAMDDPVVTDAFAALGQSWSVSEPVA